MPAYITCGLQAVNPLKSFYMYNNLYELSFEKLPGAVSKIILDLAEIKKLLRKHNKEPTLVQKLSVDKALALLLDNGYQISKSKLYKLTSNREIPFSKFGNKLVFDQSKLFDWLKNQTQVTDTEVEAILSISKSANTKIITKKYKV